MRMPIADYFRMNTIGTPLVWLLFVAFVVIMLAVDLGVFHRQAHRVSVREAAIWSAVWVALALIFNAGVYALFGGERALEFTTGYLIEKSLAIDNVFVFAMVFAALGSPAAYQHRVLFWGVLGAIVLRALMIAAGTALFHYFHLGILRVGALLVLTGIKFLLSRR